MSLIQTQRCRFYCFHMHSQSLVLPLIFLLISNSSFHFRFLAEARGQSANQAADQKKGTVIRARVIGSMPPRCQFRCSGCGPCEAVQIPVTPELNNHNNGGRRTSNIYESKEMAYSRGNDVTNYKPMGWKCKCGNLIFDP